METQPRKKSGLLLKLLLLIGLPFCLLALALAVISGPDQIRPLPVSEKTFEPIGVTKRIKQWAAAPDKKEAKAALLEIARNSNPLPNISSWTAEQQAEARRYHAEVCEVLVEYLTFVERTHGLWWGDAYKQLEKLDERMRSTDLKYRGVLCHYSRNERRAILKRYQALWKSTLSGSYVDREDWLDAAAVNLNDWDKATYYFRRGGVKGRALIVLFSTLRRIHPDRFK